MMATSAPDDSQEKVDSVEKIAQQFLSTADDYFRTEIKLVGNEYECLSQMNVAALDKYQQIHRKFQHVNHSIRTMNDSNSTKISSTYSQLNEIEDAMANLESTIMKLDTYSRSLEGQVKKLEKTFSTSRTVSPSKE